MNTVPGAEIVADRGRILQVLNNLLSNAVKYSPQGMPVEVRGALTEDEITISVVDQGKGISDNEVPYVFDKFFQSGDSNQGYGLGLAICQLVITNHQGKIGVKSKLGKGSTFWFSLPLDTLDEE